MGKFLTSKAIIQQLKERGMYRVLANELYKDDDGSIYLVWRNFETDNFTWVNSSDWDIRCSHLHDVGCKYHKIVKVNLTEHELMEQGYLKNLGDDVICLDIPQYLLESVDVSKKQINDMFYRMLGACQTPKLIQILYRCGVALNFSWYFTKKDLDMEDIYKRKD